MDGFWIAVVLAIVIAAVCCFVRPISPEMRRKIESDPAPPPFDGTGTNHDARACKGVEVGDVVPAFIGTVTDEEGVSIVLGRILNIGQIRGGRTIVLQTPYGVLGGLDYQDGYIHCPDINLLSEYTLKHGNDGVLLYVRIKDPELLKSLTQFTVAMWELVKELHTSNADLSVYFDRIRYGYTEIMRSKS